MSVHRGGRGFGHICRTHGAFVGTLPDLTPDAFSFTVITGAATSATETSNTITVSGLGVYDSATATLTGDASSLLSYNGGAWQAGPVAGVVNGNTFAVQHTSSSSASTEVDTILTIGTGSATFSSTTASPSNSVDAPVLVQTSAASTNPMTWQGTYSNSIEYDGAGNGDKVRCRWRVNGGSYTTETDQPLDATALLNGGFAWPLFAAHTFAGSDVVDVQEQKARFVSSVETGTSAWSNQLEDTMAAVAFVPSSLYGVGDIGYAWNPTDLTKVFQNVAGSTGGAFAAVVGNVTDLSGLGHNLVARGDNTTRPTLQNVNNGLIQFDGSNDELDSIGGFYAKGAMTWIAAVKSSDSSAPFIWAETSSSGANPVYAPGLRGSGSLSRVLNYQRNDANTAIANSIAVTLLDGTIHMVVITDSGSVVSVSVDGGAFVTNSYSRSGSFTTNQSTFGVANNAGGLFGPMNGSIGAGVVISRVLTGTLGTAGTEMTNTYNWIAAKHGLTTL